MDTDFEHERAERAEFQRGSESLGLRGRQAGYMMRARWAVPETNIPGEEFCYGWASAAQGYKRAVEGMSCRRWDDTSCYELFGRSNAEDVNQKKYGRPEEPAKVAVVLGVGGVGLGPDLVCGVLGHGGNVKW